MATPLLKTDISPAFLQQHSLFGGLTEATLERLRAFYTQEAFPRGALLIREGEQGNRMYFICEGSVRATKRDHAGHEVTIARMGPGDAFGEMELIDTQERCASIWAETPVVALSLSNFQLYRFSKADPGGFTLLIMNIARELSRRLRVANNRLAGSGALDRQVFRPFE